MTAILFPLRTSVELFDDVASPHAVTRAKEAAVLYDQLYFEAGLYDATFTEEGGGSFQWWHPPDSLTPELLEDSRRPVPVGSPVSFAVGAQPARGVPAEKADLVMGGRLATLYRAQFHTDILEELAALDVDWAQGRVIGGDKNPVRSDHPAHDAIKELNREDWRDSELLRDHDSFMRTWIYESFNRDAVVAAMFGAAFSITPLFQPMVQRRGLEHDFPGSEALDILVPNLGSVPWEGVAEFRDHPGSEEARGKLREFEELAAAAEPQDAYSFLKKVSQEISGAYEAAIREYAPNLPDQIALEAVKTAVSVSTGIGPHIEKLASLGQIVAEGKRAQRTWISALMRLRERA